MLAPARSRCRRCVRGGWLSVGLLGSDAWVYALLMGGGFWVPVALRVWRWWLGRGWGLRGIGPALAGKLAGAWAFALRQCSLRPDPAAAGNQTLHRSLEGLGWRTSGGRR